MLGRNQNPESKFVVNMNQSLVNIFQNRAIYITSKHVHGALSKEFIKSYNKYFDEIGLDVRLSLNEKNEINIHPKDGNISFTPQLLDKDKFNKLVSMGLVTNEMGNDIKDIVENLDKWTENINKVLKKDSEKIFESLGDDLPNRIVQKEIDTLTKKYAKERVHFTLAVVAIFSMVAFATTVSVLLGMSVIGVPAAAGMLCWTAYYAYTNIKDIKEGLGKWKESKKTFDELKDKKENLEALVANIEVGQDHRSIIEYLRKDTLFIKKNTYIDEQVERGMDGVQRELDLPMQSRKLTHKRERENVSHNHLSNDQIENAGKHFSDRVWEELLLINKDKEFKNKDKRELRQVVHKELRKIYIESHNEYFEMIGMSGFTLKENQNGEIKLENLGVLSLDKVIAGFSQEKQQAIKEHITQFETEMPGIDKLFYDDAKIIAGIIKGGKVEEDLSDELKNAKVSMEKALQKSHMCSAKIAVAVLLIIGVIAATFFAVIPAAALAGVICTSTIFAINEIDKKGEAGISIKEIEANIEKLSGKVESTGESKELMNAFTIGALHTLKFEESPLDVGFKDLVKALQKNSGKALEVGVARGA